MWTFARRDLKVQYAQTFLGILWSVIQPLTGLLIFTFFFKNIFGLDTGKMPYHLFVFTGMLCWFYFVYIVSHAGNALQNNRDLISKVYFPRMVLPLSKVMVGGAEFLISLVLLFIMMALQKYAPSIRILLLPIIPVLIVICALSIALWLSALTIRFRDFHHIIPYLVNFSIWLTPVFYPKEILPDQYEKLVYFNPMAGIIDLCRWLILSDVAPDAKYAWSAIPVLLLFVGGLMYFKKVEGDLVDHL